ncbi:hypothetical protein ACU4GD_31570 [Cupriavidus basilensis]
MSETAEGITSDYVEQGNFVKLVLDAGEARRRGSPNLTDEPFEIWEIMGSQSKWRLQPKSLPRSSTIGATAPPHGPLRPGRRGRAQEPTALHTPRRFCLTMQLPSWANRGGPPIMREQFARIQRISFDRSFDECVALARGFSRFAAGNG